MEQRLVLSPQLLKTSRTILGVSVAAFALFNLATPKRTDKTDFRQITRPIAVRLNPFSLPYAALEDDHLDDQVSSEPELPHVILRTASLQSGTPFEISLLNVPQTRVEWAVIKPPVRALPVQTVRGPMLVVPQFTPTQPDPPRPVQLKPLVISKRDVNVAKLLPVRMPEGLQTSPQLKLAQISFSQSQAVTKNGSVPQSPQEPNASSERLAVTESIQPSVRKVNDLSFDEYADQLVREEVAWREQQANPSSQSHSRTSSNSRVIVALPTQSISNGIMANPAGSTGTTSPMAAAGNSIVSSPPISVSRARPAPTHTPHEEPTQIEESDVDLSVASAGAAQTILGSIEFTDGLALTSSNQVIVVQHYIDGQALEEGEIDIKQGKFTIRVADPRGSLVAKLMDDTGEVVGRGESAVRGDDHDHIPMRPIDGVKGLVISAKSFGSYIDPVPGATVTIERDQAMPMMSEQKGPQVGQFEDPQILPGSSFVLKAEKKGFWGTVMMGSSEEPLRIPLFSDGMMAGLLDLSGVRDQALANRKGIIWGRVTRNGKPVSGVQVLLDGAANYPAVYFLPSEAVLFPDLTRTTTSDNGYFAFVHVNPGLRSVKLLASGVSDIVQDIVVKEHYVSQLTFEVTPHHQVDVQVTDAFNFNQRLNAMVGWNYSEQNILNVAADQANPKIPYWNGSGLMYLETNAGPAYWPVRQTFGRTARQLHSTPVSVQWVQRIAEQSGIRQDTQLGLVFGLVEGPNFEAALLDESAYSRMNLVYFNERGEVVPSGRAGGGFLFFNVPVGARTIGLQADGANRYALRVVPVEPNHLNVIHYQFPNR